MPANSMILMPPLVLLSVSTSVIAQQDFRFIDGNGEPVAGLVIELHDEEATEVSGGISIIDQINRTFVPMIRAINPGQSVSFPNSDNVRHHVYSFSEIKQFSTPLYANENIDPVTFEQPGIAVLGCNIHDSMVAYVYVSSWATWYQTDEHGKVSVTIPQHINEVHLWHPWLQTTDNRQVINSTDLNGQDVTIQLDIQSPQQTLGFRALRQDAP
ncbi:methylamine utilization protein [Pseudohongiella spirulinae]|uniref:Plastocyanin n=1 Tax=Pseudohongiella spirulinae TaxID=1249552 RepID=A0A0S2KCV3_9GAMM|nr:methylamine utilization protein [Pseudohongiella spirulinae]ALO46073.1 plastocyanin [Pseudohongiella spirulinae]